MNNIEVKSWEDMNVKYPMLREDMSREVELQFVEDCFKLYEQEEFSKVFWSDEEAYKKYLGQSFEVLGRASVYDGKTGDTDLEISPMWKIRFADGFETLAFPYEIIQSETLNLFVQYGLKEVVWLDGKTGDFTEDEIEDLVYDLKSTFEGSVFDESQSKEDFDAWYDGFIEDILQPYLEGLSKKESVDGVLKDAQEASDVHNENIKGDEEKPVEREI